MPDDVDHSVVECPHLGQQDSLLLVLCPEFQAVGSVDKIGQETQEDQVDAVQRVLNAGIRPPVPIAADPFVDAVEDLVDLLEGFSVIGPLSLPCYHHDFWDGKDVLGQVVAGEVWVDKGVVSDAGHGLVEALLHHVGVFPVFEFIQVSNDLVNLVVEFFDRFASLLWNLEDFEDGFGAGTFDLFLFFFALLLLLTFL